MKTFNQRIILPLLILLTTFLSGCELIGGIFEAGVWSGVILVVGVILLLVFLAYRLFGRKKTGD